MKKGQLFALFFISFTAFRFVYAKQKSSLNIKEPIFVKSLNSFNKLNHPNKLACRLDDDNYKQSQFPCKKPTVIRAGCKEIDAENGEYQHSAIEMNCNICGVQFSASATIVREIPQSELDYRAQKNLDIGIINFRSAANLQSIKEACVYLVKTKNFKDDPSGFIADPLDYTDGDEESADEETLAAMENDKIETINEVNTFADLPVYFDSLFDGQDKFKDPLLHNGKICESQENSLDEESSELPTANTKTYSVSETIIDKKILPLNKLLVSWEYQIHNSEQNKVEIEKKINLFFQLKGEITNFKLSAVDKKDIVHHLFFENTKPEIDKLVTYINSSINPPLDLNMDKIVISARRIVAPKCNTEDTEKLNITVKTADGVFETQRYILNCHLQNGKKTISLTPTK